MDTNRDDATPHPQRAQRWTRSIIVAVFAAIMLAIVLIGCGGTAIKKSDFWGGTGSSGVAGTVYDRRNTGKIHRLYIRDTAGTEYRVRVRLRPYRRCHEGDTYPACAEKGTRP